MAIAHRALLRQIMIHKKFLKSIAIVMSGMLMPIFLLVASPVAADDSNSISIIFATNDESVLHSSGLGEVKKIFGEEQGMTPTYTATASSSEFISLQHDSRVQYAEVNGKVSAAELIVTQEQTTNDPFFTTDPLNDNKQWYLAKTKVPGAWSFSKGSSSVKVAIVDTGIHATHLDLNDGRVVAGFDVVEGKPIPAASDSDDNGHGTAVAGVIGAIPNNGKGLAGINWQVSLIPVKALEANGSGSISDIATGIVWAAENGANIINLSLGGPGFGNDQTLNNAIIYAFNKGALIVAAAGNDLSDHGISLDSDPVYPICADGGANMVIGVAATDPFDQKAGFSNYGVNCVDISAPGKKILTTAFLPNDPSDNILIYGSGTSLATPIVSGVAALLKASNPNLSNTDLRNILLKTADNIDAVNQTSCLNASCNGFLGKGRINALSALSPQPLLDGALVRQTSTGQIYQVSGGQKRLVTNFVFQQRKFLESNVLIEQNNQLLNFITATPLPPSDGILIKNATSSTVYYMHQGLKRPLLYLVFQSRNFKFSDVITVPETDFAQIPLGEWYWPPDGTMVLVKGNPTVYVMDNGVKRPVTYFVFTQRKLSFAKVVNVTPDEFGHLPQAPDFYWLAPVDGTLIKSDLSPVVYLMLEGSKRAITYEGFVARNLKFSDIKTLPQAEIDVISPGPTLN